MAASRPPSRATYMLVGGRHLGQVRKKERFFIYRCKTKFIFGWSHGKSGKKEWDRVQPCAAATTRDAICSSLGRSIEPLFKKFLLFFGFGVAAASVGVGACLGSLRRAAPSVRIPCGCARGKMGWCESVGKVGQCPPALSVTCRLRSAFRTTATPSRLTARCAASSKRLERAIVRRVAAWLTHLNDF